MKMYLWFFKVWVLLCGLTALRANANQFEHRSCECERTLIKIDSAALHPFSIKGKYGYANLRGDTPIAAQFESADYFSNGVARVKENGYYGLIDKTGQIIIPCRYECLGDITKYNYAVVQQNGKYGIIDKKGIVLLPCIYDDIEGNAHRNCLYYGLNFLSGYVSVIKDSLEGLVDSFGHFLIEPKYEEIRRNYDTIFTAKKNGKYFKVTVHGVELPGPVYLGGFPRNSPNVVWDPNIEGSRFGIIDSNGEVICPLEYDWISYEGNGYYSLRKGLSTYVFDSRLKQIVCKRKYAGTVRICFTSHSEDKDDSLPFFFIYHYGDTCLIVDKCGSPQFNEVYENAFAAGQGTIAVKKDGLWGLIDSGGNTLIKPTYEYISGFSCGRAFGVNDCSASIFGEKCDCNEDDRYIHSYTFEVERTGQYHFFDKNQIFFSTKAYGAKPFRHGIAWLKREFGWIAIDTNGAVITQFPYDEVDEDVVGKMWLVKRHKSWGAVNATGKEIVPCMFDCISEFSYNRIAIGKIGDHCYTISQTGTITEIPQDITKPKKEPIHPLFRD